MNKLVELIRKARFVYVCGNGGSASTAEHFTNDLFSKGVKAMCLSSNTSILTMIANDFGYDDIFKRQLLTYAYPGDLLIIISCSGTSKNIVRAKRIAKKLGVQIFEFETFSKDRKYGKLEDKHLKFAHKVAAQI